MLTRQTNSIKCAIFDHVFQSEKSRMLTVGYGSVEWSIKSALIKIPWKCCQQYKVVTNKQVTALSCALATCQLLMSTEHCLMLLMCVRRLQDLQPINEKGFTEEPRVINGDLETTADHTLVTEEGCHLHSVLYHYCCHIPDSWRGQATSIIT